ncbi:MAG: porin family protein [Thermoanaerobaculia bacterium]|nr:porin family protein [Thermoanaerobaculia bacterium]
MIVLDSPRHVSYRQTRRRFSGPLVGLSLGLVALLASTAPAAARGEKDIQLELATGLLFDSDIDVAGVGLRASYHLDHRFWVEGRLAWYEFTSSLQLWFFDVSLKFFFDDFGKTRWYVIGGPGTTFEDLGDFGDSDLLFHFGIGAEIDLTRNLYLRPEYLARWSERGFDNVASDASLGIGWRF